MIIGSHVSLAAPDYLLHSLQEANSYQANACMIYTGAPQNTRRVAIDKFKVKEAVAYGKEHDLTMDHVIVHAPYIINLANTINLDTFQLGVDFLKQELDRVRQIGAKILVLHPGAHVKQGEEVGLQQIVKGLNLAMEGMDPSIHVALETMAGKGTELGYRFEQLAYIISHCQYGDQLSICMDTCHLNDAGYDVADFDALLEKFDQTIGLDRLDCIHINDSKNEKGARKDRHANIGFGTIGYDTLHKVVHHPLLKDIVKILETPYVEGHPPYRYEIAMLKNGIFEPDVLDKIKEEK
ncbi:deoxyribonuclease IV [Merdibacter massiliensis]|uniref:deoxyribonuclease IV n=1 Tax=Merdibacter massiliensis TaxID=1871030 RepID=UPI00096A74A2|nr:deoxyribonuclease IV [Merdibacter massiliensis]